MLAEPLKKQLRTIDLALAAGKKRQSARTKFVHDEELIPLYENFCLALALFRQKTAESVTEGKELIHRLLSFQTLDGNFPIYLHDFPRCFDPHMALKVAPILFALMRLFTPVLGELFPQIQAALQKAKLTTEKPEWENRSRACRGLPLLPVDTTHFSSADWTEWLITAQLAGASEISLPYDPALQLLLTEAQIQERGEPKPHPIEWLLAEGNFTPRLLRDHPDQLLAAPLFPIACKPYAPKQGNLCRLFWEGTSNIHSFFAKSLVFDLAGSIEMGRNDLFEAVVYCNRSSETEVFVEGRKATSFRFGDTVSIQTPQKTVRLRFALTRGSGDFCGHLFWGNRPSQTACQGAERHEAYDWHIGMRTLRRSPEAQIQLIMD